jgi:uncharacterized membrane protein
MEFDWILFSAIAIVGPAFGGKMSAVLEKKLTGEVRHENEFKIKRMNSNLISIAISYIMTFQIVKIICEKTNYVLDWNIRLLSMAVGISIYLLIHHIIYRVLLRNNQAIIN